MEGPVPQCIVTQSSYFTKLASLIPHKHFHGDDLGSAQGLKFLKKDDRASAKRKLLELQKENKRAKLNPDHGPKCELRDDEAVSDAADSLLERGDEGPAPQRKPFRLPQGHGVPREDLKEKLQQKIQERWENRQAKEKPGKHTAADAMKWRNRVTSKAKGEGRQEAGRPESRIPDDGRGQAAAGLVESLDLDFGKVQLEAGEGNPAKGGSKTKMSKQALLRLAERNAEQKDQLQQTAEGKALLARQAWNAALLRADNVKVLDDPKLLRRTVKRERKEKQRKGKQWKERGDQQAQDTKSRQAKREEHLNARAQGKKQKKKEKHQKRLTLRPGFEGRLAGFIGGNKGKP